MLPSGGSSASNFADFVLGRRELTPELEAEHFFVEAARPCEVGDAMPEMVEDNATRHGSMLAQAFDRRRRLVGFDTARADPWSVTVSDFDDVNFFRSRALTVDPYPFFDHLREQCPVLREPHRGVFMVTGYGEAVAVYSDHATFSSCNAVSGPFVKFSVPVEGDDISAIIDAHRDELPFSDQLPSFDPPKHTAHRGLLMRLITPKRLKENEDFMWRLADRQVDEILAHGTCEFIGEFAQPFTLLVIADLLGVPESDHALLREQLASHSMGIGSSEPMEHKPLEFLYGQFTQYIEERRRAARRRMRRRDGQHRDGHVPRRHLARRPRRRARSRPTSSPRGRRRPPACSDSRCRCSATRPDLQQQLRDDRSLIPAFVEEVLRLESPLKGQFRMARHTTDLAGVDIGAGDTVMVLPGAANRDPRTFECPHEFRLDRPNGRQHLAFGHGIHTCAGAPLARAEGRVAHRTPPRPHARHQAVGRAPRPARRPPLRLPADVLPACARTSVHRVHTRRAVIDLFLPEPEPREVKYTVISVDDHVVEPPHTFEGRLPAALQDRAPRIVETRRGHQVWEFEGRRYTQVGMNAVAGRRPETVKIEPFRFDQMRPGCYDVDARVRDMDINGVWASVNFPSQITGFCGSVFFGIADLELGAACVARVERLAVRGVVPALSRADRAARDHVSRRPHDRGRRDPPQRRARVHVGDVPGTAARDRPAVALGARPLGPDHRGVRRDRHRDLAARRQLGRLSVPAGLARRSQLAATLFGQLSMGVVRRVAVVGVSGEAPEPQDRDERGRHRLGRDAARPARLHRRPLELRSRAGRSGRPTC